VDWIDLAQDMDQWSALISTVMNLLAPRNFGKFLSSRVTGDFSRRAQLHGLSYHKDFVLQRINLSFLSQFPVPRFGS
jgi:hypothetical protein